MALKVESMTESPTGKRVDAIVIKSNFWGADDRITIRIVSGEEMKNPQDLLKEIVDRKDEWRSGKKSKSLKLDSVNATAYILKEETLEA